MFGTGFVGLSHKGNPCRGTQDFFFWGGGARSKACLKADKAT